MGAGFTPLALHSRGNGGSSVPASRDAEESPGAAMGCRVTSHRAEVL